jgi:hypothetical protein
MAKKDSDEDAPQPPATTNTGPTDERDRVAQRAYELYLARGGGDGQATEDWLIAETELRDRTDPRSDES